VKITLLLIGILSLLSLIVVVSYFYRIGKPVNVVLSDAYYHHAWKTKIVYAPMGNWFELGYTELKADPSTFIVLSREFGKDNTSIFWKSEQQSVHYSSFLIDAHGIPKDAAHVYYDFNSGDSLFVIEGADPQSYEPLPLDKNQTYNHWARDNNFIFLDGKKINADRQTFTLLNKTLAVDSTNIYSIVTNYEQLIGSTGTTQVIKKVAKPGGTPKVISDNYVQIGNAIVLSNWKNDFSMIEFQRIDSVKIIDERNIIVNSTALVSDGNLMDSVDINSIEILNRDFIKDKNHVFYDCSEIELADPASFTPVFESYSKDAKHAFYKNKVLEGADPTAFTYDYATNIASDGKLFFKDGVRVNHQK
jgi:hypothetical protein